jgi:hypothetical protein
MDWGYDERDMEVVNYGNLRGAAELFDQSWQLRDEQCDLLPPRALWRDPCEVIGRTKLHWVRTNPELVRSELIRGVSGEKQVLTCLENTANRDLGFTRPRGDIKRNMVSAPAVSTVSVDADAERTGLGGFLRITTDRKEAGSGPQARISTIEARLPPGTACARQKCFWTVRDFRQQGAEAATFASQ